MALDQNLVKQFAKAITKYEKDDKTKSENLYGTCRIVNDISYVQLDGSDIYTPVTMAINADDGDKVIVTIKDHKAIAVTNITNPAASSSSIDGMKEDIEEINNIILDENSGISAINSRLDLHDSEIDLNSTKIDLVNTIVDSQNTVITSISNTVDAQGTTITSMGDTITSQGNRIVSAENNITNISNTVNVQGSTITSMGDTISSQGNIITAHDNTINAVNNSFNIENNTITGLRSIETEQAIIGTVYADDVVTTHLGAKFADIEFANIDSANINVAKMREVYATSGLFKEATAGEAIIGTLGAVRINADFIRTGTLQTERLKLRGIDGVYHYINVDSLGVEQVEKEDYTDTYNEFETIQHLINSLNTSDNKTYYIYDYFIVGDLLAKIVGVNETSEEYTYINDQTFINNIKNENGQQLGYYNLKFVQNIILPIGVQESGIENFVNMMNDAHQVTYQIGDQFILKDYIFDYINLEIYNVEDTHVPYTYTTYENFIIDCNDIIQIGYYKFNIKYRIAHNSSSLINYFNTLTNNNYFKISQTFYISNQKILPNIIINEIYTESSAYEYTTDEDFLISLNSNNGCQLGYYNFINKTFIYQEGIDGEVILAKSVSADKIYANDLVAISAKIAGFNLTPEILEHEEEGSTVPRIPGSFYSGAKYSIDNGTNGVYMNEDGEINIGNENNYVKFYDIDGSKKLEICADAIKMQTVSGDSYDTMTNIIQEISGNSINTYFDSRMSYDTLVDNFNNINSEDIPEIKRNIADINKNGISGVIRKAICVNGVYDNNKPTVTYKNQETSQETLYNGPILIISGSENDSNCVRILDNEIQFLINNNKVAYISGNMLEISRETIYNSILTDKWILGHFSTEHPNNFNFKWRT